MSYTFNLTTSQAGEIISRYHLYSVPHTNNYTLFRAKYKGATLTIFKTLTMLIQGSGGKIMYGAICDILDIDKKKPTDDNSVDTVNLSVIGTDEVGAGDFFGPIVAAAVYVPKIQILPLMKLGVKDAKKLSDYKISQIAPVLMREVKYSALVLNNLKYNYLYSKGNCSINKLKALLHNNVIHNILSKLDEDYDCIIVNAFTTQDKYYEYLRGQKIIIDNIDLTQKAEEKCVAVASAGIISRYLYMKEMEKLSKEVGFDLPKGVSNKVDLAISKILKEYNNVIFKSIAKTNFKNLEKAIKKDIPS